MCVPGNVKQCCLFYGGALSFLRRHRWNAPRCGALFIKGEGLIVAHLLEIVHRSKS